MKIEIEKLNIDVKAMRLYKFEIDLYKIEKVYDGQLDCCACGCGGEYYDLRNIEKIKNAMLEVKNASEHDLSYIEWDTHYCIDYKKHSNSNGVFGLRLYIYK